MFIKLPRIASLNSFENITSNTEQPLIISINSTIVLYPFKNSSSDPENRWLTYARINGSEYQVNLRYSEAADYIQNLIEEASSRKHVIKKSVKIVGR